MRRGKLSGSVWPWVAIFTISIPVVAASDGPVAYDFSAGDVESLLLPDLIDASGDFGFGGTNHFTLGDIYGSRYTTPEITFLGKTIVPSKTIDTRTGARFSFRDQTTGGLRFENNFDIGPWASGLGFEADAAVPTFSTFDYVHPETSLILGLDAITDSLGTQVFRPKIDSSLTVDFSTQIDVDVEAYLLGQGVSGSSHFGFDSSVSLFDASIEYDESLGGYGATLGLPVDSLPGADLPIPGLTWQIDDSSSLGASDVLKRFGLGGGTDPTTGISNGALITLDLLNPLGNRSSFDTVNEGNTAGFDAEIKIMRTGLDLIEYLAGTAPIPIPTAFKKTVAGFDLEIQPASAELQVEMGYAINNRTEADLRVDVTNTGGTSLSYVDESGGSRTLRDGETLSAQSWNALPAFQSLSGGEIRVDFVSADFTNTTDHALTFEGLFSANVPKRIVAETPNQPGWRHALGRKILNRGPVISYIQELGSLGDVELGISTTSNSIALDGLGLSETIVFSPEAPNYARMPADAIMDPASVWSGERFFIDADTGNDMDHSWFRAHGYVLLVDGQEGSDGLIVDEHRRIDNVDFDHLFGAVQVGEGSSLTVSNLDQIPEALPGISWGISNIHNDGSLVIGTRKGLEILSPSAPAEIIWFSENVVKRTFTGKGDTRFDLADGDLVNMFISGGGELVNDAGHSLLFKGGSSVSASLGPVAHSAALLNLGSLVFERHTAEIKLAGETIEWDGREPIATARASRHSLNAGEIIALDGSVVNFDMRRQLENSGRFLAQGGSTLSFLAQGATELNLWNDGGATGTISAEGVGSSVQFLSTLVGSEVPDLRVRAGSHRIQALNGGQVEFSGGIGSIFAAGGEDAGLLDLFVGNGSSMLINKTAVFDGMVQVEDGGHLQLNGLGSRTTGGLGIQNSGLLEVLSGVVGPVEYSNLGPVPSFPGEPIAIPVADVEPINLANTGTVRVHDSAAVVFNANILNYAGNGVAFGAGGWELLGGHVAIGLKALEFDESLLTGLDKRHVELPALAGLAITSNRSNIVLEDGSRLRYGVVNSDAELLDVLSNGRDYLSGLEMNEARLVLKRRTDQIDQDFVNSGANPANGDGVLSVQDGNLIVQGRFSNRQGTSEFTNASLVADSYVLEGGAMHFDISSRLDGVTPDALLQAGVGNGHEIRKDIRIANLTYTTRAADGSEVQEDVGGVLDLQGRKISAIHAGVQLIGASSRFDALNGFTSIGESGTLLLDQGGYAEASDATRNSGLENHGGLTVSNGSILKIFGDYFLRGTGSTHIDSGGVVQADNWVLDNGHLLNVNGVVGGGILEVSGANSLIAGSGAIHADISLHDGAGINPGNSPGTLSLYGDQFFGAGSYLTTELEGGAPGQHDLLQVFGSLTLEGAKWTLDFRDFSGELLGSSMDVLLISPDVAGEPGLVGWFDQVDILGLHGEIMSSLSSQPMEGLTSLMRIHGGGFLELSRSSLADGSVLFGLHIRVPVPSVLLLFLLGLTLLLTLGRKTVRG